MSYILDALRRSEAEHQREEAGVPGLDAQALPPLPGDEAEAPARRMGWIWLVAGLAAGALLAFVLMRRVPVEPPPSTVTAPIAETAVEPKTPAATERVEAAPAALASPRTSLPEPIPVDSAAATDNARRTRAAALTSVPASGPTSGPSKASAGAPDRPAPTAQTNAPAASPRPAEPVPANATSGTAAAPAAPAATSIQSLAELPETLRRELPPLAVGGATYSDNPGSRLLILDGQLLREGDKPAAGLTLLQIQLKSAIFDYKGTRFRLSY